MITAKAYFLHEKNTLCDFSSRLLSIVIDNHPIELLSVSLNPGLRNAMQGQVIRCVFAANGRRVE